MTRAETCAAYFRSNPAWRRPLEELLKKYRSYGRAAGTISLPDAMDEECDALRGLFGRPFSPPLSFQAAAFESALQKTVFEGVTLAELLETYFQTTIQTKKQRRSELDDRIEQALTELAAEQAAACEWLRALSDQRGNGAQLLRRAGADGQDLAELLRPVCRAAAWLDGHPGQTVRLAVLSALASSDPHRLDAKTASGELFLHLLAFRRGESTPSSAEERDALYYRGGVLNDSISSSVTQIGLTLYAEDGEHPAFRAFRLRRDICTLSLTNLASLTAARSISGKAYLVENQMVFSQLCDHAAAFHSPFLCTSGQPQVAVLRLLDLLAASGTELFYSGDFDGKGLSIASQLLARYRGQLHLWHMAPEDYQRSRSGQNLSEASLRLLQHCDPLLAETVSALREHRKAGYQELLLRELLADLTGNTDD